MLDQYNMAEMNTDLPVQVIRMVDQISIPKSLLGLGQHFFYYRFIGKVSIAQGRDTPE